MLDIFISGGECVDAGGSRSRYPYGGFNDCMQIYVTHMKRRAHTLVKRGVPAV